MYPWQQMAQRGLAGQMLGMAMGQAQQACPPQMYGNTFTMPMGANNAICFTDTATETEKEKPVEPPTEFEQLSNHKFHELLAKFAETI